MGGKKRLTLPAWFSVFVDAPLVINVPDATGDDLNKYDSAAVATHTPETDPALIPRAWWRVKETTDGASETRRVYEGFDESMRFIRRVIDEQGPFDACFGFSQGAAMAAVVSSILEHPSLHSSFSEAPLAAQKPFKAAILVAGFRVDLPSVWNKGSDGTCTKLSTRSLHVIGNTDVIVSEGMEPPCSTAANPKMLMLKCSMHACNNQIAANR
ncbi:uncharacterized protein VP01_826g6 [Puccinia sorghi]|uniref:Serine hydrolase domain-containing protein n=1 Tax=Puccinia sorghi TaxID=27349 RepID=A0A0L6U9X1_9BASI|nr:uncharacterized protein VP01_826g6 [Puccinia sorghi]